jgi:hypothetical protein
VGVGLESVVGVLDAVAVGSTVSIAVGWGKGVSGGDVVAVGGTGVFVAWSCAAARVGVAVGAGVLVAQAPKNSPAAAVAPVWINWRRLIIFWVRFSIVIVSPSLRFYLPYFLSFTCLNKPADRPESPSQRIKVYPSNLKGC